MLVGGYFDESTDESSEIIYTVAGYMVPGHQAAHFEMRWADLLKKWSMAYLKASQLEYGFGEFVQYRDNPSNKTSPLNQREKDSIQDVKTDFDDLIWDGPALWGFSATMNLRHWTILKTQEPELASRLAEPYFLCGQLAMMAAGYQPAESSKASPCWATAIMRPIFDSHEDYEQK